MFDIHNFTYKKFRGGENMRARKIFIILSAVLFITVFYSCGKSAQNILCYKAKTNFSYGEDFTVGNDFSCYVAFSDDTTAMMETRSLSYDSETKKAENKDIIIDYSKYDQWKVGRYQIKIYSRDYDKIVGTYTVKVENIESNYTINDTRAIYDGTPKTLNFGIDDETVVVRYSSDNGESYILDSCPQCINAGTYDIYYKIYREGYTTYEGNNQIIIEKAQLTISVDTINIVYGEAIDFENCTYTAKGLKGDDTLQDVLQGEGDYITNYSVGKNAGEYDIVLDGFNAENYTITYTRGSVNVAKGENNFETVVEDVVYGEYLNPVVSKSDIESPSVKYQYSISNNNSYLDTRPSRVGSYDIKCTCMGDLNYNSSVYYIYGAKITKADLYIMPMQTEISFSEEFNDENVKLSFIGFKFGENEKDLTGEVVITTNYNTGDSVGNYNLSVSGYQSANYNIIYRPGNLKVSKIKNDLKVTFYTKNYDGQPISYTIENNFSENEIEYSYKPEDGLRYTDGLPVLAGIYTIKVSQEANENYTGYYKEFNAVTINKRAVAISWGETQFYYDGQPHCPEVYLDENSVIGDDIVTISAHSDIESINASTTSYSAICDFISNPNYCIPTNNRITFWIHKCGVDSPTIENATFDGEFHRSNLVDTDLYTLELNNGGTNAYNQYKVVLKLRDMNNYSWTTQNLYNGEEGTLLLYFEIVKAQNEIYTISMENWIYNEGAKEPEYTARFYTENRLIEYRPKGETTFTRTQPELIGEYEFRLTLYERQNFLGVVSDIVEFKILKADAKFSYVDIFNVELGVMVSEIDFPQETMGQWVFKGVDYQLNTSGIASINLTFEPFEDYQYGYNAVESNIYVNVVENLSQKIQFSETYINIPDNTSFRVGESVYLLPVGVPMGYAQNALIYYSYQPNGEYSLQLNLESSIENIGAHTIYLKIIVNGDNSIAPLFIHRTITITP